MPFSSSAELQEEIENVQLAVVGDAPKWLSGSLIRNGPINAKVNGRSNFHWFDGLAMLHAFTFQNGGVHYTNKFIRSEAYQSVFKEGSLNYLGFAVDPCRSLFKTLISFFIPAEHVVHNANINVAKIAENYVALTEYPLPVRFDPQTLATLGVLDYEDKLPKDRCWESAHPHRDRNKKGTINYLIQYGVQCDYILYFIPDQAPAKREVIAKIPVKRPAYMHSFAVTENYIIFTEFPVLIKPFELILGTKPFIKNFTWEPEKGTGFIVVDRHHGNVIGRYVTKPFFAFHHVNAFEKENQIHLDIVTYENGDIVLGDELSVNNRSSSKLFSTKLERFYLSLETGDIQSEVLLPYTNELPRINSQLAGSSYRFVYSISTRDQATYINEILFSDGLYKIDTVDKRFLKWSQEGCLPGEPVFVASPKGIEEDDGVVLSVVIDRKDNSSFLLILDGKSFQEIGRAKAPHLIPVGLHGVYF